MASTEPPLEVIVRSNEKLLRALIAILSVREEGLLEELTTVVELAQVNDGDTDLDRRVWVEIRRRLILLTELTRHADVGDEAEKLED